MTKQEKEIADLKQENRILMAFLERWQQQYGYREPWKVNSFGKDEKGLQGPPPKAFLNLKINTI